MVAIQTFTDFLDVKRMNGEEWLITLEEAEAYIPDVYEKVVNSNIFMTLPIIDMIYTCICRESI